MSASEIQSITTALRELSERMATMEEKMDSLRKAHDQIQCAKENKRIKWESIIPSVLSSLSAALVMYLVARLA